MDGWMSIALLSDSVLLLSILIRIFFLINKNVLFVKSNNQGYFFVSFFLVFAQNVKIATIFLK